MKSFPEMTWSTAEIQYKGLPLLLRRPNYHDVWKFREKFNQLFSIEHVLEKVSNNGLPEKSYNQTLAEFDNHMCTLLDNTNDGMIILIETFSGTRNYHYYTSPEIDIASLVRQAENNFKVKLKISHKPDTEWNFIKTYPVELYP